MKKFLKNILLFSFPFLFAACSIIYIDIFEVFFEHKTFHKKDYITLNGTYVATKTYLRYKDSLNYNAFIFGSSRAGAFKAKNWKKFLPEYANTFHYGSQNEDVYGCYKKMEFLSLDYANIDFALIIIDDDFLKGTKKKDGYGLINPSEFNDRSAFNFYLTNFIDAMNPKLNLAYLDYNIFKTYRPYMKKYISNDKYPYIYDAHTCDIYYGYDKEIKEDSFNYYNTKIKQNVFYERPIKNIEKLIISEKAIELLKEISAILKKHKTEFKIIISPNYNQIALGQINIDILESIFDSNSIYNFSGVNTFTNNISNYYESSHYRPIIANKILDSIY